MNYLEQRKIIAKSYLHSVEILEFFCHFFREMAIHASQKSEKKHAQNQNSEA